MASTAQRSRPARRRSHAATSRVLDRSSDLGIAKNLPNGARRRALTLARASGRRVAASDSPRSDIDRSRRRMPPRTRWAPPHATSRPFDSSRRESWSRTPAAAMSRRQPGVLFTLNDSGNEPLLFAIDTTGADRGVWRVVNATNVDWESAAIGAVRARATARRACTSATRATTTRRTRRASSIERASPTPTAAPRHAERRALRYVYSDGPHDVEAMYVAPNGDILLITKRPLADRAGGASPRAGVRAAGEFVGASAAERGAELIDSLPIVPGSAPLRADHRRRALTRRPTSRRAHVCADVHLRDESPHRPRRSSSRRACATSFPLGEAQGEGITWVDNAGASPSRAKGRARRLCRELSVGSYSRAAVSPD